MSVIELLVTLLLNATFHNSRHSRVCSYHVVSGGTIASGFAMNSRRLTPCDTNVVDYLAYSDVLNPSTTFGGFGNTKECLPRFCGRAHIYDGFVTFQ